MATAVKASNGTEIRVCTCASMYQDMKYGMSKRLHNLAKGGSRCSVCGDGKGVTSKKMLKSK